MLQSNVSTLSQPLTQAHTHLQLPLESGLRTAADLLASIAIHCPNQPLATLRATVSHFARYIGVSAVELEIAMIHAAMAGFSEYLTQLRTKQDKPLARNSVHTYTHHAHLLLRLAAELGWKHTPSAAEAAWNLALAGVNLPAGCVALTRFAIARDRLPGRLTDSDLEAFIGLKVESGRHPKYLRKVVRSFRNMIGAAGLEERFPLISPPRRDYFFGIPVASMPEPLQSEVRELIHFKTQPGRRLPRVSRVESDARRSGRQRREIRIRPISARALEGAVSRLFGFAVSELGVDSGASIGLLDLVSEQVIDPYIDWQLDVRRTSGSNFNGLRMLHAALLDAPEYKSVNLTWFTELIATIPEEDEEAVVDRKSKKYLPWAALCAIPAKIAAERSKVARGTKKYARLIHDELFISWMVAFVWRQLNLRSCNLGALARIANLFKGPVDANHNQTKPEWVRAELERNPDATFYQIHFTRDEIKGKQAVWSFVPEHLVLLLEDYLVHQRSLLVGPVDHGTLFLNRDGNPLTAESLEDLFGRLTLQHAGRWATPHLVRDAFAHAWLDDHPEDYLTVSRVLMHRSIRQTLLRYGRNYDASRALEKTSTWLQQRLVR